MNNQDNLAVSCVGVKKVFKDEYAEVTALKKVDLEVKKGELLMLVGPSGSGKTTLISVIAGILDQDEGSCKIFGVDLNHLQDREKTTYRGENIGFVFQSFNLIPMLTNIENVAIPLIINNVDKKIALEKAKNILIKLEMEDKINKYPYQLSGGQQQRVAIARSYIHNPKIIVCDEPTSALDSETGQKVLNILKNDVLDENRAIIVVTHDNRIFPYADRIANIQDGIITSISNTKNSK